MSNPELITFQDAQRMAREIASARRRAEADYKNTIQAAAEAEAEFRKEYALVFLKEGVETRDGESVRLTVAEREQKARLATADLARNRDIQQGLAKACQERLAGLDGERSLLRLLADWSMKIQEGPQPAWSGT